MFPPIHQRRGLAACFVVILCLSLVAVQLWPVADAAASAPERLVDPTGSRPGFYVIGSPLLNPNVFHIQGNLGVWTWADLHSPAGYHWGQIESFLDTHDRAGRAAGIMISPYEGRCCGGIAGMPAHLRNANTVVTLPDGWQVPRYWSTEYKNHYRAFVQAFADAFGNDPRLHYVAIGTGQFGETRPTDSQDRTAITNAGLSSDLWVTTVNEITQMWVDAFSDGAGGLKKPLLLQAAPRHRFDSERREFVDYAVTRGVGVSINGLFATQNGVIRPAPAHCQSGREIQHCGMFDVILRGIDGNPNYDKVPIAFETYGYMVPDRKHFRWALFNGLNKHPDYIRVRFDILYRDRNNPQGSIIQDNNALMAWGKQYLGVTLQTTPAVWVALREHVDPWYSPVLGNHTPPYESPAERYQAGNYDFWLHQVEMDGGRTRAETNDPRINQPGITGTYYNPALPSPGENFDRNPEAWVIRRTQQETGQHRMYFNVNDGWIKGGSHQVVISVVYWDNQANDHWQLWYDSTIGPKPAHPRLDSGATSPNPWVEKEGSGKFRRVEFYINDARFNNSLDGGTDFYIDSRRANGQADGNEWIHYVEVRRQGVNVTPLPISDDATPPTPTPTATPTGVPTATPTPTPTPTSVTGSAAGRVYVESDAGNSSGQSIELVSGATVRLHQGSTNGPVIDTVTTTDVPDAQGNNYKFSGLTPGQVYGLTILPPDGYQATSPTQTNFLATSGQTFPFHVRLELLPPLRQIFVPAIIRMN